MVEFGHCTIAPPLQGAALALEDEQLGFDIRYFGDNHSLHPDPFVALLDAARATTRIKLATVLASGAQTAILLVFYVIAVCRASAT